MRVNWSFRSKIGLCFFVTVLGVCAAAVFQTPAVWIGAVLWTVLVGLIASRAASAHEKRMCYLEGSLDAVQLPVTVTDLDMKWVFINKVTESLLTMHNLDKKSCLGKHCSSWKADICGTENCGIAALRQGRCRTNYNQEYPDKPSTYMQVDTSYIKDRKGRRIGHVEIVTNIDAQFRLQNTVQSLAASMEETSASMEEISSVTQNTASTCCEADRLMGQAGETVTTVGHAMEGLTETMNDIKNASEETSKIVKTIDDIAFQTNLLALNAAVEAARAGEAGAGFAVVADEVRSLALQAADAARSTSELIERTVNTINGGHSQVNENNTQFKELSAIINQTSDQFDLISTATKEQSLGINQVNEAIRNIEQVLLQNSGEHYPEHGGRATVQPNTPAPGAACNRASSASLELVGAN